MTLEVRRATRADMPAILDLLRELAEFEKLAPPDGAAYARLVRDLGTRFDVFVGMDGARAVAYAMFYETYSSFAGKPRLWLEDMYVTPTYRKHGVGRSLMREVAKEAIRRGCSKATWVVLDWNTEAQKMYDRLGGAKQPWLWYEMDEAAVRKLADTP
jgi:GNAT superfamily N-acetyltransferase